MSLEERSKKLNEAERDFLMARAASNRRLIRLVGVGVVVNVLLSAAVSVLAIMAFQTAATATSAKYQAYIDCLSANEGRKTQIALWDYILSLPPTMDTPQQRAEIAQFKQYVHNQFRQRKC